MPARLNAADPDFDVRFQDFLNVRRAAEADVDQAAREIVETVRANGDAALLDYTRKYDRFDAAVLGLRITPGEIAAARKDCEPDTIAALDLAAQRIKSYHARQLPDDLDYTDEAGIRLGHRWRPVPAVGMYVPGGTAAYPSSVLMNAIPAHVAGVPRLVMAVPAPDGEIAPLVLAAADLAGVDEIYRVGGAQAVAALAFGTETIAPVDKIVGPGNAYVAAAKRMVFGTVGIDAIAGPSEILVVADGEADPSWIAADLLAQAEHDTSAQSILVTDSAAFADEVARHVDRHLQALPRSGIAGESWRNHGAIIVVPTLEAGVAIVDRIAPEHLEIATAEPDGLAQKITNAGAIFLGNHAPEAVGDYIAGPNHVLPTGRSARFSSGLGVLDFMKRSSIIGADRASLARIGPAAVTLARAEGLDAHALSLQLRMSEPDEA
ncbi:MAG: histidinol dehydrogenase [Rhodospirillales bacterium]|nr:histidinol dehydrogenase [Rhodospirillales bacterium]